MNIIVRRETENDCKTTEYVVEKAFEKLAGKHDEHLLVANLRKSDAFVPELSLVAEIEGGVVGHILLTKLNIKNEKNTYGSLALAPISVLPEFQNKGIGSKLIFEGIKISKQLGYRSIIVLGHKDYYLKFGFRPASMWGIKSPFNVKDEHFMALELEDYSLFGVHGNVEYAKEFF